MFFNDHVILIRQAKLSIASCYIITLSGLLQAQIANRGPVLQQLDSSARDHLHADFPGNILSRLQPAQRDSRQSSKSSSVNAQEGEQCNRSCTVIFFLQWKDR